MFGCWQRLHRLKLLLGFCLATGCVVAEKLQVFGQDNLQFTVRMREPLDVADLQARPILERSAVWDPHLTAVIICDMWDDHWCTAAADRVAAMAPQMNALLCSLRKQGALIVHSPSDCMEFYAEAPQRRLVTETPLSEGVPEFLGEPCRRLDGEPDLPIDDSDGGCDCNPQPPFRKAWTRQIATLEIFPEDAISDSGREIYNLFVQRGIRHVLLMGVHTNMCVVGRSFGLRQMVRAGLEVVLVRDMTDAMYNPEQAPFVSHRRGTEFVIQHIETHICPTTLAADLMGEAPPLRVLCIVAEDEYHTWETLPQFAESELAPRGIETTFLQGSPQDNSVFPELTGLETADVVLLSVRRRLPSAEHLAPLREYLESGRPLVGIRTASHPFESQLNSGQGPWPSFDTDVLQADYQGHYGADTRAFIQREAMPHPILTGLPGEPWEAGSHLYKIPQRDPATTLLLLGKLDGQDITEPVAWTANFHGGRIFYTSLGSPDDFEQSAFRRLLVNAIEWAAEREVSAH